MISGVTQRADGLTTSRTQDPQTIEVIVTRRDVTVSKITAEMIAVLAAVAVPVTIVRALPIRSVCK